MSDSQRLPKLRSEQLADDNYKCRQIVKEITTFGVSNDQIKYIIYLLALEIENIEHMREITALIKELSPEIFVSSIGDDNG